MQYRIFGRTGWQVSEIGLGTWTMGGMWGPVDEREAVRALQRAMALGVNFIDTALVYGDGAAESLIAKATSRREERVLIATKIPPKNGEWPARHEVLAADAFPADWIVACTERSLRSLKRSTIDLQQFHVWSPRWASQQEVWRPAIERLKREGKIRAFGISVNDHEPDTALEAVESGLTDAVQVIYNLFDQTPAERLLPACRAQGVGVIARVPLDEGSLTGRLTTETVFHPEDWRHAYFRGERLRETLERVDRLRVLEREGRQTLAQAALRFCLSHPAVSTVIPGMRRVSHVEENCAAGGGEPLSPQELETARQAAWARNFYEPRE